MRWILPLRCGLMALMAGLLLSCGGGGGGTGGGGAPAGTSAAAVGPAGPFDSLGGTSPEAPGSGIGGIASDDGSATTASAGDDGSGVGSGGTGVSTADATGVGAVDGAGSIIVNGLRYDTRSAVGNIQDASNGLQLGMSVKVTGPVNADFSQGVARLVESAAELRGPVASVNLANGSFVVLGTTVTTDESTVWADAPGLAGIAAGQNVQIWGRPASPGVLRATRVEQRAATSSEAILTGTVQNLDETHRTFALGNLQVDYAGAPRQAYGPPLSNGIIVRVRGEVAPDGRLVVMQVQPWYPMPMADGEIVQFAGIVAEFDGLASLRVLGYPVDASTAQISGGLVGGIGNGVTVEVGGVMNRGIVRASKLKIRHVPGSGGPVSFELFGNVAAFGSPSDFRVKGQPVNAGSPGVTFTNGQASGLRNGVRVHVSGTRVVDGVLMAQTVSFE